MSLLLFFVMIVIQGVILPPLSSIEANSVRKKRKFVLIMEDPLL